MIEINYGPRAERFAMRPLEKDYTINILEGAVRSGKTWCLHSQSCLRLCVSGRRAQGDYRSLEAKRVQQCFDGLV